MKKFIIAITLCIACAVGYGQTSAQRIYTALMPIQGSTYAQLIPSAKIYVCQYNAQLACTTPINIYSDINLQHIVTQPLVADPFTARYQYFIQTDTLLVEKVCAPYNQCTSDAVLVGNNSVSSLNGLVGNLIIESLNNSITINYPDSTHINLETAGAGGVTSLNSLTGALSLVGDSSLTVTPSGSNINLHATGSGGSGVQYNPTTTAYFVTSFSGLYDDSDANSTNLGVPSSVSCTGSNPTTCTVAFAAAHGLSVGGAIDMSNLSTWPVSPAGAVQQSAQYGSFQVTTVPDSTHITFDTPTALTYTCGPCTGNVYDATYWGIWTFAREPYIYGHGTVYGIETSTQSVATNLATWIATITGTPKYLIDQTGQNDFAGGRTVAQVEADHQSLWAAAHTAGMTVVETTIVPANYGLSPQGLLPGQFNEWLWQQAKTPSRTANGQYWDRYADTATAVLMAQDGSAYMPKPQANVPFADVLNEAFSAQKSHIISTPINFDISTSGSVGQLGAHPGGTYIIYDNNWNEWLRMTMPGTSDSITLTSQNQQTPIILKLPSLFATLSWCSLAFGTDLGTNNGFSLCMYYAGSGSTANFASIRPANTTTDLIKIFADGSVAIPALHSQSTIGTDANGKLIAGSGGGGAYPQWHFDDLVGNCCTGMLNANSGSSAGYGTAPVSSTFGTSVNGIAQIFSTATANTWSALYFGGASTGVQPIYLSNTAGSYSFAGKVWSSLATGVHNKIALMSATSGPNPTYEMGFECDTTVYGNGNWWAETQGSATGAVDTTLACVGAWHQLEIKVVNGAISWYADGTLVTTGTVTASNSTWYPDFVVWSPNSSTAATLYLDWVATLNPSGITLQ